MTQKNDPVQDEEVKTDLKHDTMEFSAATEGDDKLDSDDEHYEEDAISADDLDFLEDDAIDNQAEALVTAETDRQADEDNLPEEDWLKDIPGVNPDDVPTLEQVDLDERDTSNNNNYDADDSIERKGK